jgi:hypothetical protein
MSIENNSTIEQSRNTPKGDAQSLPKGWVETTLGEVVSKLGDGLHGTPKYLDNGEYFFINGNNIAFFFWVLFSPLFGSFSKECHIEHICFCGVYKGCLLFG